MICSFVKNIQRNKEPWLAVSLSWLVPGAGQVYADRYARAVIFIALAGLFYVFWLASLMSTKCSIVVSLIVKVFNLIILPALACVDAFVLVKASKTKQVGTEKSVSKDPWLAAFLSLLLPGLGHAYIREWASFGLYLFGFGVLRTLSQHTVYAFLALPLFRAIVCIHAYRALSVQEHRKMNTIIMFVVFLISVGCLKGILMRWIRDTYLVGVGSPPAWSVSMVPTLGPRDVIVVNKLAYAWNSPQVGDIVLVKIPKHVKLPKTVPKPKRPPYKLVKRIVAIGGETVQVKDGRIYTNGKERTFKISKNFDEVSRSNKKRSDSAKVGCSYYIFGVAEPYRVPKDCYFVLGDNIENSMDSRYFGPVPKEDIIGKIAKICWPPNRIRLLD